jgi:hypothetical protein
MKATWIAGLVVLLGVGVASASTTVTLTGSTDGTSWYVWAKVTGDGDGLSFLDLKIANINEIGVYDAEIDEYKAAHVDTVVQDTYTGKTLVGTYGFNQERGSTTLLATPHSIEMVFGMNPGLEGGSGAKYNVRHIGEQSVTFTYKDYNSTPVLTYGPSQFDPILGMLVADGVCLPGITPSFTGNLGANVWADNSSAVVQVPMSNMAEVTQPGTRLFLVVPEPATLALMGAGAVLTLVRRRRR